MQLPYYSSSFRFLPSLARSALHKNLQDSGIEASPDDTKKLEGKDYTCKLLLSFLPALHECYSDCWTYKSVLFILKMKCNLLQLYLCWLCSIRMRCYSQYVALSAEFPAHGILISIMFKCFSIYNIHGLRLLVLLFHFFSSLMASFLYSYNLGLILTFFCSFFFTIASFSPLLKSAFFFFIFEILVKVLCMICFHSGIHFFVILFFFSPLNCCSSCMSPLSSRSLFLWLIQLICSSLQGYSYISASAIFLTTTFSFLYDPLHASCISIHILCQAAHCEKFVIFHSLHFSFTLPHHCYLCSYSSVRLFLVV